MDPKLQKLSGGTEWVRPESRGSRRRRAVGSHGRAPRRTTSLRRRSRCRLTAGAPSGTSGSPTPTAAASPSATTKPPSGHERAAEIEGVAHGIARRALSEFAPAAAAAACVAAISATAGTVLVSRATCLTVGKFNFCVYTPILKHLILDELKVCQLHHTHA